MARPKTKWRNWRDHPIFVVLGILAAFASIIGLVITIVSLFKSPDISNTPEPKKALVGAITGYGHFSSFRKVDITTLHNISPGDFVEVTAKVAHIRDKPDFNADTLAVLEKGTRSQVLSVYGDWLKMAVVPQGGEYR